MRLPKRSEFGHAVYMHRPSTSVRDLDNLTVEQLRFLGGVAARISKLIEAIKAGTTMARYKLGTKRLEDGRRLELELVARVSEGQWHNIAKTWGQIPPGSSADEEA